MSLTFAAFFSLQYLVYLHHTRMQTIHVQHHLHQSLKDRLIGLSSFMDTPLVYLMYWHDLQPNNKNWNNFFSIFFRMENMNFTISPLMLIQIIIFKFATCNKGYLQLLASQHHPVPLPSFHKSSTWNVVLHSLLGAQLYACQLMQIYCSIPCSVSKWWITNE